MQINETSRRTLALAWLLWLMLAPSLLGAQTPPPIILDDAGHTSVATQFIMLTDTLGQEDVRSILNKDQQGLFSSPQSGTKDTGYSTATYWMKLRIANPTAVKDWFLVAESPHMQLDAWLVGPDEARTVIQMEPVEDQSEDQSEVVPLNVAAKASADFFVRVRTPYIADLQFQVMNRKNLNARNYRQTVFASLVAGCFLAMIVYNFFLFLILRDVNYLLYLIFAVVNSHLNLLVVNFPTNISQWLGWNWWSIMPYYVPMAPMVTFIFARSFLQTRKQNPRLDKALLAYMGGLLLIMAAAIITPPAAHMNFLNFYMLLGVFLLLLAGLHSLLKGYQPARFFLAGIGTFLIGILLLLMRSVGLLPSNFFTNNVHLIAQASEMLLMSLALGNRIKLLEDAKTRAEVTAEVKSGLLRIISHDIVTPLTVVKATAYQLKKEVSDPSRVDRVVRATSIIEDIVGFIRKKEMMESGEIMQLGPVALKDVFDELAFLFLDRALEKNITLKFELEPPDLAVQAEPVSLSNEVLGNLISNAIKFSFAGSKVLIRAQPTRDGRVRIIIQDQGVGMDAATLSSLFNPSVKQSRQGTQGEKGIGFGMPLAKAYVDAYGGRIEAQSRAPSHPNENTGTTLSITLDAARSAPSP